MRIINATRIKGIRITFMKFLGNAFSLQMLDTTVVSTVRITPCSKADIPADAVSCVGHADTAAVLGVPYNRTSLKLDKGDVLYVTQLSTTN